MILKVIGSFIGSLHAYYVNWNEKELFFAGGGKVLGTYLDYTGAIPIQEFQSSRPVGVDSSANAGKVGLPLVP